MDILALTKALADETRLRLLTLLSQAHLTLAQCKALLGQSGPRLSRHLKILVEAELLGRSKEGKEAFFRLSHEAEVRALVGPMIEALARADRHGDLARLQAQIQSQQREAQELEAKFYAKWQQARAFFVDEQQAERRILALAQSLEAKGKKPSLLDIGTGTGRLLSALAPYVSGGLGIDRDRDMLAIARHRLAAKDHSHLSVQRGDMYDLQLGAQTFDLVCLYGVLRYATLPTPVLRQAASALGQGGALLVVDFLEHDQEELSQIYGHKWLGFDPEDMKGWSAAVGLTLDQHQEMQGERLTLGLWRYSAAPQSSLANTLANQAEFL